MAVRVVKKEPDPSVIKEIVCGNCGVTLEYVPNDAKIRNWSDYGGGSNTTKYIVCPECNYEVVTENW